MTGTMPYQQFWKDFLQFLKAAVSKLSYLVHMLVEMSWTCLRTTQTPQEKPLVVRLMYGRLKNAIRTAKNAVKHRI